MILFQNILEILRGDLTFKNNIIKYNVYTTEAYRYLILLSCSSIY